MFVYLLAISEIVYNQGKDSYYKAFGYFKLIVTLQS